MEINFKSVIILAILLQVFHILCTFALFGKQLNSYHLFVLPDTEPTCEKIFKLYIVSIMKIKTLKTWAMIVAAVSVGFTSCNLDIPQEIPSSFDTMVIEKSDITIPLKFSARMKGKTDVTITPQVSGQLMQICVVEGEKVQKGQTLFIIDSRNAQLELEAAQANFEAAVARESSAKLEYESNKNLFEKKIVSSYMLDNSLNSYRQASAAVAQARASMNRAKVNLGFCTVSAPVAGIIGEIPVHAGDQVSPMVQLTMLSGNTDMTAEFSVTESIVENMVQAGKGAVDVEEFISKMPPVTFVMKNGTEYPHKGKVVSLTGVVNATTGSLTSKVSFPNPEGYLYSGIQGTIVIPFAEKGVITIPQNAVVRLQDKSLVYMVKADSTATAVDVTTEDTGNGKDFIVTSGLKVGDKIVTIGANNVTEGMRVLYPKEQKK